MRAVEQARERLSEAISGPRQNKYARWLGKEKNEDAQALLETWLKMAPKSETDWSASKLWKELRNFGFPCGDYSNFAKWMNDVYDDDYQAAIEGAREARLR